MLSEQEHWSSYSSATVPPEAERNVFFLPSFSLSPVFSTGRTSPKIKLASLETVVCEALASKLQCRARERVELKADRQRTGAKVEDEKGLQTSTV